MSKLFEITKNITDWVHGDCENELNSGYYFISVKDLDGYKINYNNARQITYKDYLNSHKRTKLEEWDILFANSGDTIWKMLYVDGNNVKLLNTTFQKSIALFKPNIELINDIYFYYLIKFYTNWLIQSAVWSAQKNLLLVDIRNFNVKINHELIKQKSIVTILKNLDSKIELNNKINSELEKMSKTLYDYWFVQFDFPDENWKPYKSSGWKMVWSEELKREIPEGWGVKKLKELLKKNNQKFTLNWEKHDIDTIDLSVMPSWTMCLNDKSSSDKFGTNLFKLNKYDILFWWIRPYLLKAWFSPFNWLVTWTVHSFKVKNECDYNFALITMISDSIFNFAVVNSKWTKMPVIWVDDLLEYKVAYNETVVKKYNEILYFKEIISKNILENQKLAELRDWLLPMLMNGQVSVK